jgi:hypothetical protein
LSVHKKVELLSLAELGRRCGIPYRTIQRYAKEPEFQKFSRFRGGRRRRWLTAGARWFMMRHQEGLASRGRPPNIGKKGDF